MTPASRGAAVTGNTGKLCTLFILVAASVSICAVIDFRALLFIPLLTSIATLELLRPKKLQRYDFLTLIGAVFAIGYVIAPICILSEVDGIFFSALQGRADTSDSVVALVAVSATVAYWGLIWGYARAGMAKSEAYEDSPSDIGSPFVRAWTCLSVLGLVAGSAAYLAYADIYGGVVSLLLSAAMIRAGEIDAPSKWVFVVHMTPLALPAVWWCYWKSRLSARVPEKVLWALSCAALLVWAVVMQAGTAGRSIIILVLASVLLAPYVRRGVWPSMGMAAVLALGLFGFVVVGKELFGALSWGTELGDAGAWRDRALASFVKEFTHLYLGVQNALDAVPDRVSPRWATDLLVGIQWLLPTGLFGHERSPTIAFWNTELLTGSFESEIPPGLVGYSYYALLIPGLIVVPFTYGVVCGALENALLRAWSRDARIASFYIVVGLAFAYGVMNADPRVLLVSNFWIFVIGGLGYVSYRGTSAQANRRNEAGRSKS
jgi:hypothetical protein